MYYELAKEVIKLTRYRYLKSYVYEPLHLNVAFYKNEVLRVTVHFVNLRKHF